MQSSAGSQSPSQESGVSSPSVSPSPVDTGTITRDDAKILQEYLDDFQDGDVDLRSRIIANALADICELREETEPFDKDAFSKVSIYINLLIIL